MNRVHELTASELYAEGIKLPDMSGQEKKVCHNTWIRHEGTFVVVRYHATDIALINHDGSVTVNSGGWETSTTKQRLNALLPGRVNICQRDFRWYFWRMTASSGVTECRFVSYATVKPDGTVWFGSERML